MEKKLCVARDQDGFLGLYNGEPERMPEQFGWGSRNYIGKLPQDILPEVTWENGVKYVEIKCVQSDTPQDIPNENCG